MPDLVTMDFKINGYNLKQSTAQLGREKYVSINTINVLSAVITGKDKLRQCMKKAVINSRLGDSNTSQEEVILKLGNTLTKTIDRREMEKQGMDFGLKMLST